MYPPRLPVPVLVNASEVFYCLLVPVAQTNHVWYAITVSSHLLRISADQGTHLKMLCMYDLVFAETEVNDLQICLGVSLLSF